MRQLYITLLFLLPLLSFAKNSPRHYYFTDLTASEDSKAKSETPDAKKYTTFVGLQNLHSTHSTDFKGIELAEHKQLTPRLSLGLGAEYSWCGYHFDNGYNLTDLKFLPVYLDSKMNLTQGKPITPYLHLASGVSFANYSKQDARTMGPISHVSEEGIFLYSGGGVSFKINHFGSVYIDLGFKGYHMSFDALDINPHGLTMKLGIGI